jgi:hypothetical protein
MDQSNRGKKYARKVAELPEPISHLTIDNFRLYMKCQREDDKSSGSSVMVAVSVSIANSSEPFMLESLTLDQLRVFARNIGVRNISAFSKFKCRRAIYELITFLDKKDILDCQEDTCLDVLTSNIIRLTNVIFSNPFYEDFIKLNDIKTRVDHEAKRMPSSFWNEVSNTVNCCAEDDSCAITIVMDPNDLRFPELNTIDLSTYENMDHLVCKKMLNCYLKLERK